MIPLAFLLAAFSQMSETSALSLNDLDAYQAALKPGAGGSPRPATFRDLWDHPEAYRNQRVQVEGRVEVRFHQGPQGAFPSLVELWIVSPTGDPTCLVFPEGKSGLGPSRGAQVQFSGVFLKRLRYRAGDVDRLAPWIVGDSVPTLVAPRIEEAVWGNSQVQALLAVATLLLVTLALVGRHLAAPRRHRRVDLGPSPAWYGPEDLPSVPEEGHP